MTVKHIIRVRLLCCVVRCIRIPIPVHDKSFVPTFENLKLQRPYYIISIAAVQTSNINSHMILS